ERRRDSVPGKDIERISHRQSRALLARGNRQHPRAAQEFRLEPIREQRRLGVVCGPDDRRRDQLRHRFSETTIAYQTELGEHLVEACACFDRNAARTVEAAPIDRAAVDEHATQPCEQLGGVLRARRSDRLEGHDSTIWRKRAPWPAWRITRDRV